MDIVSEEQLEELACDIRDKAKEFNDLVQQAVDEGLFVDFDDEAFVSNPVDHKTITVRRITRTKSY